jgi:hypothetical protein
VEKAIRHNVVKRLDDRSAQRVRSLLTLGHSLFDLADHTVAKRIVVPVSMIVDVTGKYAASPSDAKACFSCGLWQKKQVSRMAGIVVFLSFAGSFKVLRQDRQWAQLLR